MHKPFYTWTTFFRRLGLKPKRASRPAGLKPRSLRIEPLAPREMLAGDVLLTGFYGDGTHLVVDYEVTGEDAQPFEVGIYRCAGGADSEALVASARVSKPADLAAGVGHRLAIKAAFADVESDYVLVAKIEAGAKPHPSAAIEPAQAKQARVFEGGVFLAADGTLHVHGTAGDDQVAVAVADSGGVRVRLVTEVSTAWREIPLVVAEVRPGMAAKDSQGADPEQFILVSAHLDAWYAGMTDTASTNVSILEMARILHANRSRLRRGFRFAWWTGHSTGRYAGSTWYADMFAQELVDGCVAHLNCDYPGCRWATDLTKVSAMAELVEFTRQAVCDISGQYVEPRRIHRAGDCSFNNLGISATMMLSSAIPDEVRKAKGMYGVGGCGGNNEWHTEGDTLEIADKELLLRDTRLYALMVWRLANLAFSPLDYSSTAREIARYAREYQEYAGQAIDLSPVVNEATALAERACHLYQTVASEFASMDDQELATLNALQRRIGRELVEIGRASCRKECRSRWSPYH